MAPRHISSSRAHRDKIPTATTIFGVSLSSSGTSDIMGRRCVLEIQNGSRITGSTNNFFSYTVSSRWAWLKTPDLPLELS